MLSTNILLVNLLVAMFGCVLLRWSLVSMPGGPVPGIGLGGTGSRAEKATPGELVEEP